MLVRLRLSTQIKVVLLIWCVAEVLAFAIVAKAIGVPGAILLGTLTSLIGFSLLKRAGTSAMLKLRATMEGRGPRIKEDGGNEVLDDTLAVAGAIALLLPGFLSDIVGLTLALPALRGKLGRWVSRGGLARFRGKPATQRGPTTIDLGPEEWRRTDPSARPVSKA